MDVVPYERHERGETYFIISFLYYFILFYVVCSDSWDANLSFFSGAGLFYKLYHITVTRAARYLNVGTSGFDWLIFIQSNDNRTLNSCVGCLFFLNKFSGV